VLELSIVVMGGMLVLSVLHFPAAPCRWIGRVPNRRATLAGITAIMCATDGTIALLMAC